MAKIVQRTKLGAYYHGAAEELHSARRLGRAHKQKFQLILTSPPFPLNTKKAYGNLTGQEYLDWFSQLAGVFSELLADDGSIVIELGNAWEPGRPVQSTLPLECLLAMTRDDNAPLSLCQQFVCYNPARLPSPAQWVTVERTRVTDSYTHVWWYSKTDRPKADNRRILRPYSQEMKSLLERQSYNPGRRPSEHHIGEHSFNTDNGGSIPHNFFELEQLSRAGHRLPNVFSFANTSSTDHFLRKCRETGVKPHPARMPVGLAKFFVEFLTEPNDFVLDPFAGSNTTGYAAELLGRQWVSFDASDHYVEQSRIRFKSPELRTARRAREQEVGQEKEISRRSSKKKARRTRVR